VRSLSRCLAAVCRHLAVDLVNAADSAQAARPEPHDHPDYHETEPQQQQQQQQEAGAAQAQVPGSRDAVLRASAAASRRQRRAPALQQQRLAAAAPGAAPPRCPASGMPAKGARAATGSSTAGIGYQGGAQGLPYPPDLLSGAPFQGPCVTVNQALVDRALGPGWHSSRGEAAQRVSTPGSAAGLVWTAAGGMVQYVECCCVGRGAPGRPGAGHARLAAAAARLPLLCCDGATPAAPPWRPAAWMLLAAGGAATRRACCA
jgi:ATP-dependent Lon protease